LGGSWDEEAGAIGDSNALSSTLFQFPRALSVAPEHSMMRHCSNRATARRTSISGTGVVLKCCDD
jgi:hypothetical protein